MSEWVFWCSVLLIVYTYAGFPAITWLRSICWRRPCATGDDLPPVSILIAAHNEEQSIRDKINNVLSLDYPSDRLSVIVASDGSSDRTVEILREFQHQPQIVVLDLPRAGKAAALNVGIKHCTGDIIVFSDANSMFAEDAVRLLVRSFTDPKVGGVAGDQRYSQDKTDSAADQGERSYWNFDRRMKWWQTQAGNVTSATGAIYAIRRSLFQTVPEGVTDDFITSTSVIQQGYRLVFDVDAASYEPVAKDEQVEFGRKVRIITRGLQGVLLRRRLLNPVRYGFYAVQLFSHKVLRRQMVIPIVALFVSSIVLAQTSVFYLTAAVAQCCFYAAAIGGMVLSRLSARSHRLFSIPYYFCMVNLACLIATLRTFTGRKVVLWETQRGAHHSVPQPTAAGES